MRRALYTLIFFAAVDAHAFSSVVFFPVKGDTTKLYVNFLDGTKLIELDNECTSDCATRYWLIRKQKNANLDNPVASVDVIDHGGFGFDTLDVRFTKAVDDVTNLHLVVTDLVVDAGGKPKSAGWKEYAIAPQIEVVPGERPSLMYQSLLPMEFKDDVPTRAKVTQGLAVTDADDTTLHYSPAVTWLSTGGDGESTTHTIALSGVPRGRKMKATLKGVEQFGAKDVAAGPAVIEPIAFPKGRDDALLYLRGSAEANDVKGQKIYSLDFRLHPKWTHGSYEIAPNIEATIGNKLSKAPNTGSAGVELRRWFATLDPNRPLQNHAIAATPTFWTDREFDNRDAGAIISWEPTFKWFEGKTLEQRRMDVKNEGGLARSVKWGFRLRPTFAIEAGQHIASSSTEVDGENFKRLLGKASGFVQYQQWTFSVTAESRHLFDDEVLLTSNGVVATDDGARSNVRLELAYDFGPAAVSLARINGRLPPAFSATESLSLGVTFKY